MKAIVTGAGGFAGRWLVRDLQDAGWRVTTLSRRPPADRTGDLLTQPLRGLSADVVFHLAAFSNPSESVGAEDEVYASNVAATARVLREIRARRFVVVSSCQVHAEPPRTPYAASKRCAEAVALASDRDVVVVRPFNHTGPGQSADYVCPSIARQIARAERGGPRVIRLGNLSARRDFLDVRDVVRAYRRAAERGARGAAYDVATGRPIAIGSIASTLASLSRVRVRIQGTKGAATVLSGDPLPFRRATGWGPEIPLRATLADLLDHERAAAALT